MPQSAEFSYPDPIRNISQTLSRAKVIDFVRQSLGEGLWDVEITDDQVDHAINTTLRKYGRRMPFYRYGHIELVDGQNQYKFPDGIDSGFGVAEVQFIQPIHFGAQAFINKRLLGITTVGTYRLDDFDIFVRWRQTFERVTSTLPEWMWEEDTKTLWIYNPIPLIKASYMCMVPPRTLEQIRYNDEDFIYDYVLNLCKRQLAENRSKFSNAIPGPSKDIAVNGEMLFRSADEKLKELDKQLLSFQRRLPPAFH